MNETITFKNPLGRPLKYTPQELVDEFGKYVEWCKNNPLKAQIKTNFANGGFSDTEDVKPRRISIDGFQVWLGCSDTWWENLEKRRCGKEFGAVKASIKKYCETYQKDMASAGLMKENIISRLLGLADKKQVEMGDGITIVVGSKEEKKKLENMATLGV